jgi:LysR family transcriptional regulator, regulator for genes of the gallate degradation pathway
MDLRSAEQFIAVVEEGSFRAAAVRLGITQPALTKIVRRLEDELGARLLDRFAHGARSTPAGEAFLRHARALKAIWAEAQGEVQALGAGLAGRLRIGAGPAWHRTILPLAVQAFHRTHPNVRLVLDFGSDRTLKALLRDGRIDAVLAALPEGSEEPDLAVWPLVRDAYRVFAGPAHPLLGRQAVPLADLLGYPWVISGPGTLIHERLRALFVAQGLPAPEPMVETDIFDLKLGLMLRGPYLTCNVGEPVDALEPSRIRPLDLAVPIGSRAAGVITWRGSAPNAAIRAFIDTLSEVCAAPPIAGRG